ncbi:MAG TPA: biotin synthetase [Bdellovibrionales bacterium]|nr:biotin synthetase [Bdellovibrionales bacterium]
MSNTPSIGAWTGEWAERNRIPVEYSKQIGSTNSAAKDSRKKGTFLLVTDHQTQGRGRGGNTWTDAKPGTCLLSSWVFTLQAPVQPIAAPLIGLALYEAAQQVWPELDWSVKAPNDLYLLDKKIAGLLLETVSVGAEHRFVAGLGMNIAAHPDVPGAGPIDEYAREPVSKDQLHGFLDHWWLQLQNALPHITHSVMPFESTCQLLVALNRYPKLEKKFDEVQPDGSLRTGHHVTPWTAL